ncbi:MAG: hypothetical protein SFU83_16600 [Meiothermus sp.]|nr:hypothetical protein [Meiothermus sp.]
MFNPRTFFLTLSFSLLAACGSVPQATDPVEDIAALADANGDLEAVVQIQSVGSSALQSQAETVHLFLRATYNGKPIQGFSFGATQTGTFGATQTGTQNVTAAVAAGDRMRIRGRVRSIKGVPTFVGLMQADGTQASAAAVQAVPVALVGGSKALPPAGYFTITLEDALVSGYITKLRDSDIILFRTADGKPFASAMFKPTTAIYAEPIEGTWKVILNLKGNVVQTPAGPVGEATGQIQIEGRQPVGIIAILIGL